MLSYSKMRYIFNHSLGKLIIRNYRRKTVYRDNAGIKKRLAIFSEENPQLNKLKIDEEALDELETDLSSGKKLVDFHKRNIDKMKKETDLKIIERKYFSKKNIPNFLTWAEKEQIRDLHRSDPLTWTFEKLSASFPANQEIIKKIIKSVWRPENKRRIVEHDQQVGKNWEKLRKGEINIDPWLKQHLTSFSSREKIQYLDDYDHVKTKMPALTGGSEFSRIITDYKGRRSCETESVQVNSLVASSTPSNDTSVTIDEHSSHVSLKNEHSSHVSLKNEHSSDLALKNEHSSHVALKNLPFNTKHVDRKLTTLEELRKKVKKQSSSSEHSEFDEAFLRGTESASNTLEEVDDYESIPLKQLTKHENKFNVVAKIVDEIPDEPFPMKIEIPADVQKASIYKVKDVYYDTDGKFLYRVPGMK